MKPEKDILPNEELLIVELDERLEFGIAAIDSDLDPEDNTNCTNSTGCTDNNWVNCTNTSKCNGGKLEDAAEMAT